MRDFDKRFAEMGESHRRMKRAVNAMFIIVPTLMVVMAAAVIYYSVKHDCVASMVLNGACLSDPAIDKAVKNVIK